MSSQIISWIDVVRRNQHNVVLFWKMKKNLLLFVQYHQKSPQLMLPYYSVRFPNYLSCHRYLWFCLWFLESVISSQLKNFFFDLDNSALYYDLYDVIFFRYPGGARKYIHAQWVLSIVPKNHFDIKIIVLHLVCANLVILSSSLLGIW